MTGATGGFDGGNMLGNIMIFGDSYSTYKDYIPKGYAHYYYPDEVPEGDEAVKRMCLDETWWRRLIRKTGANLIRNDSWSGSTICYTGYEGDCSTTNSFIYRYRKLRDEGFFKENKIDTLFVFGGTNDSWGPAELGERKLENQSEEDLKYVLPAISHLMFTLKAELSDTRIIFIANCDIDEEIVSLMKDEGERLGIEVVELHGVDKISGHPTVLGMSEICEQILYAIGE